MIHPNEPPETPEWTCEPRPNPVTWLDDFRPVPPIPDNIILGGWGE